MAVLDTAARNMLRNLLILHKRRQLPWLLHVIGER